MLKRQPSRFLLILFLSFLITAGIGVAIRPKNTRVAMPAKAICSKAPTFKEYPASESLTGKSAELSLSGFPAAMPYRAYLRTALSRGVNFGGKYTLVEWGCGANCQDHAVIDGASGRLVFFGLKTNYSVEFYRDSRLLILNPGERSASSSGVRAEYFLIESGRLSKICE